MIQSVIREAGVVQFPAFNSERHYMVPFFQRFGLPEPLRHWQRTVNDMLSSVDTDRPIYFMADQSKVVAGTPQRRPGVHVDGYWVPALKAHGGGRHRTIPSHRGSPGHRGSHMAAGWADVDFSEPEAIILASDVRACKAYVGEFGGIVGEGGDCSSQDLSGLSEVLLEPNRAYIGTVGTLHESLPVPTDCFRTLVRLNVPGYRLH